MNVISVEHRMLTPEDAADYLAYVDFGQRPIDKNRVTNYAEMMRRGQWRGGDGW